MGGFLKELSKLNKKAYIPRDEDAFIITIKFEGRPSLISYYHMHPTKNQKWRLLIEAKNKGYIPKNTMQKSVFNSGDQSKIINYYEKGTDGSKGRLVCTLKCETKKKRDTNGMKVFNPFVIN